MFQGLRVGSLFYILEKGENIQLKVGQVQSVSNPAPKNNQYIPATPYLQPEMVVDVAVKVGNDVLDFKQLPATESIVNFGSSGMVVSESKNAMSAEVESMIRNSQSILDSVPHHEKTLHACDAMLRELNPQFAKEKEQEEKIGALEEKMNGIEGTLGQMMTMLSSALDSNRKTKNKED